MARICCFVVNAVFTPSTVAIAQSKCEGRRLTQNHRLAIAAITLIAATIFLHASGGNETLPPHLPLHLFPSHLNAWDGTDVTIPQSSLNVLGPGDFLLRDYQDRSSTAPDVSLFL